MGFVSFTSTLKTGVKGSIPVTGTKPDFRPGRVGVVKLAAIGLQGAANDDSVIVWFCTIVRARSCGDVVETYLGVVLKLHDRADRSDDLVWEVFQRAIGV